MSTAKHIHTEQTVSPTEVRIGTSPSLEALTAVNQTLFNPVYARALESMRRDGIVADPFALRIVRELSYNCDKFANQRYAHIGSAVRTRIFDRICADFLNTNPDGVIVVLGCGLDARPYRMDNGRAAWLSIDLPDVITLREHFFTPDERRRHLACSVLDESWFDAIPEDSQVLALAEGLSMYLPGDGLHRLVTAMAGRFPGSQLALESLSHGMVAKSHTVDMNGCGVAYTWGMDSGKELEAWSPGIRLIDEFPLMHEERRRWGPFALLSWLPVARKISKISLFRFAEKED